MMNNKIRFLSKHNHLKWKIALLFTLQIFYLPAQKITLKDAVTNKKIQIKNGKHIGLETFSNEIINYHSNNRWYVYQFTDSTLTIIDKITNETKIFKFIDIKTISLVRNEHSGGSVAALVGGSLLITASPFVGIQKNAAYNLKNAGLCFGIGAILLAINILPNLHNDLRMYEFVKIKH